MKLGFTGTQRGMTRKQAEAFTLLIHANTPTEFHHGDCIGADYDADTIVKDIGGIKRVVHPPSNDDKRAHCGGDEIRPPKTYLERNKDVVNETDRLVATPKEAHPALRSGTWATIRYATRQKKPVTIIWTDGKVTER